MIPYFYLIAEVSFFCLLPAVLCVKRSDQTRENPIVAFLLGFFLSYIGVIIVMALNPAQPPPHSRAPKPRRSLAPMLIILGVAVLVLFLGGDLVSMKEQQRQMAWNSASSQAYQRDYRKDEYAQSLREQKAERDQSSRQKHEERDQAKAQAVKIDQRPSWTEKTSSGFSDADLEKQKREFARTAQFRRAEEAKEQALKLEREQPPPAAAVEKPVDQKPQQPKKTVATHEGKSFELKSGEILSIASYFAVEENGIKSYYVKFPDGKSATIAAADVVSIDHKPVADGTQ